MSRNRRHLKVLATVVGLWLLVHLIRRAGPARLLDSIVTMGWTLGLVIALAGISHVLKTWAWRIALLDEKRHVSFGRMLGLRLASEAAGQLGAIGQIFGEGLRATLLNAEVPAANRIASVTLDRALFILSAAVVTTAGMLAVVIAVPLPHRLAVTAGIVIVTLLGVLITAAIALRKKWPVFSGPAAALGRIGPLSGWVARQRSLIESVESTLLEYAHRTPGAFWGSFVLNLGCHALALGEVWLILWLMGVPVSAFAALAIEALTKLVNIVGVFNPGNLGTYEGGNMMIVKMFGLAGADGLTLGVVRRVRALFWAAVGGVWLMASSKSKRRTIPESSASSPEPLRKHAATGRSHVAVVLANRMRSPLTRVGALPTPLRIILEAQKAGAARIVVVVDRTEARGVMQELLSTHRLPALIEWYEAGVDSTSIPSILGKVGGEEDYVALIAADRIYHPSLHRRIAEWNGESDALAFASGTGVAGIYLLSTERALDVARCGPRNCATIEELDSWLMWNCSLGFEPVSSDHVQQIVTPQDRVLAERKLDSWLFKPTDGIFARTNRRVSIPISRAAIRFPITPNMVSLFTLGVSFLAGLFFGLGGYWNVLVGALLSVFASVLDGCDGEVARLTLQESDFGCWLDTICDHLYYVFVFVGMTIGLVRSTGMRVYLVWGALVLFGAVATLLITAMQRRRLAGQRPEQYLRMWQAQASTRQSNPFLYLARNTEFIIRRCFLPYLLLFFAVFNIWSVVLMLAVVGANVAWPIALYSYCTFGSARMPAAAPVAVSAEYALHQ